MSHAQVLGAAGRAMERAAFVSHEDLRHELNTLATIASIAPLVGLFGTLWGIFNAFGAVDGDKLTIMAVIAEGLSRACVPTAIGLLVALLSLWGYRYFQTRLREFDGEMADVRLGLLNQLALQRYRSGALAWRLQLPKILSRCRTSSRTRPTSRL